MSMEGARAAGVRDRWYRVGIMTTNCRGTASKHARQFNLHVDVLADTWSDPPLERWRYGDGGWQKEMFL